jgi:hypothetical protein
LKRAVVTENEQGRLSARVDGKDPYFVWQLENAIAARLVSLDVEASEAGSVQLFWSSTACPTFRESCSLVEQVSPGRQWVDFLLDRRTSVRELRFDLPDKVGVTLWFHAIDVFERADMSPRWLGRDSVTTAQYEPYGLALNARAPDPWMTVTTPGLMAADFDTVELVLRGADPSAPQLFWDGPCKQFEEACSVHFHGADAGALTHVASLRDVSTWRGAVRTLRLDPAQDAGTYVIERIAFSRRARGAANAKR